jgi:hypothetical protein
VSLSKTINRFQKKFLKKDYQIFLTGFTLVLFELKKLNNNKKQQNPYTCRDLIPLNPKRNQWLLEDPAVSTSYNSLIVNQILQ